MIELSAASSAVADVEFDEYVPVTVTWAEASEFREAPVYVRCVEEHRLLELKFSPLTTNLVELVLVNSPGLKREQHALSPEVSGAGAGARWTGGGDGWEFDHLDVTAYDDVLTMVFSTDPVVSWVGRGPVVFGTTSTGSVGAVGVHWSQADQDIALPPGS